MNPSEQLRKEFPENYKRFLAIIDTDLWEEVLQVLSDDEMLSHIIFSNDVLGIPPVKTFLYIVHKEEAEFENTVKQSLGAVFGYLFCEILDYKVKESVSCRVANIKTATRYKKN